MALVVWFDLPVRDLDRAIKFYSKVLKQKVAKCADDGKELGVLPHEGAAVGGCLVMSKKSKPSTNGALLYLSVEGRLRAAVKAAVANGGTVLAPVHAIGTYGFCAIVRDTEGNRIALHAMANK